MSPPESLDLQAVAELVDFVGSVLLTAYTAGSAAAAALDRGPHRARLLLAQGALTALSLKLAGALLRTLALQSWEQLGAFAAVLALRMLLKQAFLREGLQKRKDPDTPGTWKLE